MMKNIAFYSVLTISCVVQGAFANPVTPQQQPVNTYEQAVFGNTPQAKPQIKPKNVAKPIEDKQVLSSKDLRRLIKTAQDGNITAANAIKEAANNGDRQAALQYGYLVHTGKLPSMGTNYAVAMKAYKKAARQRDELGNEIGYLGNYIAAYNIGIMYQQGQGVPHSAIEAYRWFKIANEAYAEQRPNRMFYPAAVQMARALQSGVGVARDDKAALQMWLKASKEGSPDAMVGYANMVAQGRGTIQNPNVAFQYYKRAADNWNLDAIMALAQMYAKGDGISREPNLKESAKWYIVLATVNKKKFGGKERLALSKLSEQDQKSAKGLALSWLTNHSTIPEPFDYTVPLSEEPKRYY